MQISVIIPSYNGKHLLEQSLQAVFASDLSESDLSVTVVDNCSEDGTGEWLNKYYTQVQYAKLSHNTGFTGAINHGIRRTSGEYLFLLNNDCHVEPSTLAQLRDFLIQNPLLSATQPVVVSTGGVIENIGYTIDVSRAKAFPVTDPADIPDRAVNRQWPPDNNLFYGLSATALMISRDAILKIGLFTESFHSYLEDIDLSIRMARNGIGYAPCLEATVTHKHMATSSTMGTYKQKQDLINWIRIIRHHYSPSMLLRYFPGLLIERGRNVSGYIKKLVQ